MKFRSFFSRGEQQQSPPLVENETGPPSQEDLTPRRRRQFGWFHSKQAKKDATHNRTESNETSITHLSINESYSTESQVFVEETQGSYEVLSPKHMVQYGKSLLELDAAGSSMEDSTALHKVNQRAVEQSIVEGLGCIVEESGESRSSSNGSSHVSSREVSPNPSLEVPSFSEVVGNSDENPNPERVELRLLEAPTPTRMIQMDGTIVSNVRSAWIESDADDDLSNTRSRTMKHDHSGDFSRDGESSEGLGKKTHQRNFLSLFSRPMGSGFASASPKEDSSIIAATMQLEDDASPQEDSTPTKVQRVDGSADKDLGQRKQNERWTAPDGTPRFLA